MAIPFLNTAYFSTNVGIGTETPSEKLTIKAGSSTDVILGGEYSSTTNKFIEIGVLSHDAYINLSNSASTLTVKLNSDGVSYLNGGNVGIGTTAPGAKLEIVGNNGDQLYLDNDGDQYTQMSFYNNNAIKSNIYYDNTNAEFWLGTTGTAATVIQSNGADRIHINSAGNVGIGTSTPTTKLDVNGVITATGGNSTQWNATTAGGPYLPLSAGASFPLTGALTGTSAIFDTGTTKFVIKGTDSGEGQLILRGTADSNNYWEIGRESAARGEFMIREWLSGAWVTIPKFLIARTTGNTAIGYSATNSIATGNKLAVNGSGYFAGTLAVSGSGDSYFTGDLGIGTTSPNVRLQLSNATALTPVYQQFTNGTTGVASGDGTIIGIDADGDFVINNQEVRRLKFYTSDTLRLTIQNDGTAIFDNSVGIGNTNPGSYKLKVTGTTNFTGALLAGDKITTQGDSSKLWYTLDTSGHWIDGSIGEEYHYFKNTSSVWTNAAHTVSSITGLSLGITTTALVSSTSTPKGFLTLKGLGQTGTGGYNNIWLVAGDSLTSVSQINSRLQVGFNQFVPDLTNTDKLYVGGSGKFTGQVTIPVTPTATTHAASKAYVDAAVAGVPTGDITGVTAGTYLTGGGTSGTVTLNVDASDFFREVDSSQGSVATGWITVASTLSSRKSGEVIVTDGDSSDHAYIRIVWMRSYADSNFSVLNCGGHANRISGVRVLSQDSDVTYGTKYLQIYVSATSTYYVSVLKEGSTPAFDNITAVTPILQNSIVGYSLHGSQLEDLDSSSMGTEEGMTIGTDLWVNGGDIVLGGTGRIQGIDTVSATTDAANKAYVDAHGGGVGPFLPIANPAFTGVLTGPTITTTGTVNCNELSIDGGDGIWMEGDAVMTYDNTTLQIGDWDYTDFNTRILSNNGGTQINLTSSGISFNQNLTGTGATFTDDVKLLIDKKLILDDTSDEFAWLVCDDANTYGFGGTPNVYASVGSHYFVNGDGIDLEAVYAGSFTATGIGTFGNEIKVSKSGSGAKLTIERTTTAPSTFTMENTSDALVRDYVGGTNGHIWKTEGVQGMKLFESGNLDVTGNIEGEQIAVNAYVKLNATTGAPSTTTEALYASSGNAILQGGSSIFLQADKDASGAGSINLTTKNSTRLHVDNDGNVGIGTTSPSSKLSVHGNVNIASDLNATNDYAALTLHERTVSGAEWYGSEIRSINTNGTPNYLNPRLAFLTQDTSTYLKADRTEKMSILGNGNVGIGITNPSSKLDVIGEVNIAGGDGLFLDEDAVMVYSGTQLTIGDWDGGGFDTRIIGGSGSTVMDLTSTGVGIGTNSPDAALEVLSSTSYETIKMTTNGATATQRVGLVSQHYTSSEQDIT